MREKVHCSHFIGVYMSKIHCLIYAATKTTFLSFVPYFQLTLILMV
jgi:hypothetical protein